MTAPTEKIKDDPDWRDWLGFVGPLASYLFLASVVIAIWERVEIQLIASQSPTVTLSIAIFRLICITALLGFGFALILQRFPIRISPSSIAVGLMGAAIWILLCRMNLESKLFSTLGFAPDLLGKRESINPWALFETKNSLNLFLFVRFSLLIMAVPIAEELFLRGFLLPYFKDSNWSHLPLEKLDRSSVGITIAYGVMTHPSEWIAASIWFAMITIMMLRTRRFWDCVVAHSVTNTILGIYIILAQDWRLW